MKDTKFHKHDFKNKAKFYKAKIAEEEISSLKELKRKQEHKHYRNYENALHSRDIDLLMSYEED
jgi:hypothetical protein